MSVRSASDQPLPILSRSGRPRGAFGRAFGDNPSPPCLTHPIRAPLRMLERSRFDPSEVLTSTLEGRSALPTVSRKNSTPARPSASFLASAPGRTGVDFFPSYRS